MRSNLRSTLTFLLGWPLSLIAIFFLARSFLSHSAHIRIDFSHTHWVFIFLGLISFMGYYFLRSYIWYTLLKFHGYKLDPFESLFQWSSAQLKRYIPGNIWGVVGVSVHFADKNVTKKELSSSFITESVLVLLSAFFLSFMSLPLIISVLHLGAWGNVLSSLGLYILVLGTLVYFFSGSLGKYIRLPKIFNYVLTTFSFSQISSLWALMAMAFICYGLGTYFVVSSIAYLDPTHLWLFIGYFIFSLLIGFLSFITPTGLGVREGAIALGLSTIMAQSLAAFTSLFARFILVIAEVCFIALICVAHKLKKGIFARFFKLIREHSSETLLVLSYLIFVGYFSFISILRYENFYAGRFDLGNMEQTVWNTLHGNIFQLTNPNGTNIVSRLSFHADFILVLLAPIYFLWQDPRMLLLIQTIITGAGAFFVYLLGLSVLKNRQVSLSLALLYLLNPSLERSVIYDFHGVTLATTFLLGAFYFLYKKKYGWFILFSLLAAITKEQIWVIIALFGLYTFIFQKRRIIGAGVFLVSSAMFYLFLWKIIPQAAGAQHFALSYYSNGDTADSPTSLIESFLFSPLKTFHLVFSKERLDYLTKLFAPVGYLSIFSPLFLIFAGPDLTINMLSSKSELFQIYYQYTAAITPFIFISALFGIRFLQNKIKYFTPFILIIYLLGMGLYSSYLYGPLPGAKEPNLDMITRTNSDKNDIDKVLAAIPPQYSVSTSNSLGSHATHRAYLFTMPYGWDSADYIIFLTNETNAYPSLAAHKQRIQELLKDKRYTKYFDDGTLIAFRKTTIQAPKTK